LSNRRAVKPINEDAARAANDAIAAETGGRPLTMGPEDAALREKWMDAYVAAGGEIEETGKTPKEDPTEPVKPCPKRLQWIKLISLRFWSDYGLIKNEEEKWTNTGVRYPVPEWIDGRDIRSPIVHNIDKKVKLDLTFEAGPPGACAEQGTIAGTGPEGIQFNGQATFKPGKLKVTLTSDTKTPKRVDELDLSIDWTVVTPPVNYDVTTQNTCYLVMNKPVDHGEPEDGVTKKRAETAVSLVGEVASLDPHTIVGHLMEKFPFYTLEAHPDVPAEYKHPTFFNTTGGAWPMADNIDKSGECQAIVRFVRGLLMQVGCPGDAKTYLVWSDPTVSNGTKVLEAPYPKRTLHDRKKKVNGVTWYAALADRDPVAVGTTFTSDDMGMNTFEACLRFSHGGVTKYYGGGAGVYDSHEEVIHAFHALVWFSYEFDDVGNTLFKIEEIVQRYR
jgi:hypothetical protein